MFYIKLKDLEERTSFISNLREQGVQSTFHYIPLHSAPAGQRFGRFFGADRYTTQESERLVRLPLYYGLTAENRLRVISATMGFWGK
jgi:dTDP-4-amino-4,6-dideoxygalactose transaminase